MYGKLRNVLILMSMMAFCGLSAAEAQKDSALRRTRYVSEGPQLELFVATRGLQDFLVSEVLGSRNEANVGVRGSFHFTPRLAIEGSLQKLGNYDGWSGDLSLKYYVKNRGRLAVYLVGGPGWTFGDDLFTGDELTVHLGLGLEIPVGSRFYFRPEVRALAFAEELAARDADFSLGFGWRF